MRKPSHHRLALLIALALAAATAGFAADPELQALRAQITALEAQLKTLSRQLELKEQAAAAASTPATPAAAAPSSAAAAAAPAKVTINDRGYTFASADAANSIRLRALLQTDARFFVDDGGIVNDTFTLRRARLITEGGLTRAVDYQFVTEFGGSSVSILDAFFTVDVTNDLQFKVGKYKTPVGHEVLQSDAATSFTERSIVANLLPNRDVGLLLIGNLAGGALTISGGAFNGVADGTNSTNTDFDERKDFVARIVATPWRSAAGETHHALSFGVGASRGTQRTAAGRTAGYRTDGQQAMFAYNPSVVADGDTWRVSPFIDYRHGPLGLMAEYVVSAANLRPAAAAPKRELKHEAWQATAGYVLTGEDSSYGLVSPKNNFSPADGTWGAFEVYGRYSAVDFDDAAFPVFASPAASATDAHAYALGLNWYLTKAVVFKIDYYQTRFGLPAAPPAPAAAPLLRQDEKAFVTRFQLSF